MANNPPKYPLKFLRWFCKSELVEEIEGDLNEEFEERKDRLGTNTAKFIYAWQILTFFRPYAIKSFNLPFLNFIPMYSHYGKIAFRNFTRQKLYTGINILSLAIGIACTSLIYLFIQDELNHNSQHEKADQIVRINRAWYDDAGNLAEVSAVQSAKLGMIISEDLPEIEHTCRFYQNTGYVKLGENPIQESFLMADPTALKMFTFEPIYGQLEGALSSPKDVILSARMAEKYFGNANPVGETLQVNHAQNFENLTVKAVVANPPQNSTVKFDILLPIELLLKQDRMVDYINWGVNFLPTFALLEPNVDLKALDEKLPAIRKQHMGDRKFSGRDSIYTPSYQFQPLTDLHFNTATPGYLETPVDASYMYILGGIGLAILILACINFMILAVGRSARRAREIGLRKVIGAKKKELVGQFLSESVILSFIGLTLGLGLAYLALPTFNELATKSLGFELLLAPKALMILLSITLLSGLFAGSYPAFLLSNFNTVSSLRNQYKLGGTNMLTRLLVSTQFSMSIILIIGTLVMMQQLHYLNHKNLGFDEEELVVVYRQGAVDAENFYQTYKNQLSQNPRILNISGTNPVFTQGIFSSSFNYAGKEIPYNIMFVDANYVKTLDMEITMGRDFDPSLASDSTQNILINETFAKALEVDDPIGKPIKGLENADYTDPIVVGVVKDFHFSSLREEVGPVWLAMNNYDFNFLLIKVQTGEMSQTISELEDIWKDMNQDVPFKYTFMDENLAAQYESEEKWKRVVNAAAILAIFISCMGLFGLVALSVAGRTKEIGIRKVLGASLGSISMTLSKEFSLLILIAFVVSIPIGWYFSTQWLQNFAYKISISPLIFLAAGALIFLIFAITMSYHVLKAGRSNPIEALRNE